MATSQERLDYLVKTYEKDITPLWEKYEKMCKEENRTPIAYLTDISLYKDTPFLGVAQIEDQMNRELGIPLKGNYNFSAILPAKEKKAKLSCSCGSAKFLQVSTRGSSDFQWQLPSGRKGQGYAPPFPGIVDGKYLDVTICIDCGKLKGFNKEELNEVVQEEEDKDDAEYI